MTKIEIDVDHLRHWADTIRNMAHFVLFSEVATKDQRLEMATLGTLHAELIDRMIANVTDDFGFGVVADDRMPVDAAGCSGAVR